MDIDAISPIRSFRAAYALFLATPLFVFAQAFAFSWLTMRIAPRLPRIGSVCYFCQVPVGQALILFCAGLPTWNWFRQLRQANRRRGAFMITIIAIAHYSVL